jgi:acyl-CoA thioester hydrolase
MPDTSALACQATVTLEAPFHDVDSADVVWHGNYYKYFERARSALLRSFDYDVPQMLASGFSWPVIESHCRHVAPLRYGDTMHVTATLVEVDLRLKIAFDIRTTDGRKIARGHTIQVAVNTVTSAMCVGFPPVLMQRILAARGQDARPQGGDAT